MTNKKIYRYSNVELLDLIKNGQNNSRMDLARRELERRNLTQDEYIKIELEYVKFQEYKEKRKEEPLSKEEWISFFFLPFFNPKPNWRKDHFSQSELQRFEYFGFDKKAKQAIEVRILGVLFWIIMFFVGMKAYEYFV